LDRKKDESKKNAKEAYWVLGAWQYAKESEHFQCRWRFEFKMLLFLEGRPVVDPGVDEGGAILFVCENCLKARTRRND